LEQKRVTRMRHRSKNGATKFDKEQKDDKEEPRAAGN
jgi:hypothetical protein